MPNSFELGSLTTNLPSKSYLEGSSLPSSDGIDFYWNWITLSQLSKLADWLDWQTSQWDQSPAIRMPAVPLACRSVDIAFVDLESGTSKLSRQTLCVIMCSSKRKSPLLLNHIESHLTTETVSIKGYTWLNLTVSLQSKERVPLATNQYKWSCCGSPSAALHIHR